MKIHQILGAPSIILTNEEQDFIKSHHKEIPIRSLYDRGVYEISNDNLILTKDANNRKSII
jgi:hypothetical protein